MRGKFIVFEGTDGVGKSTQLRKAAIDLLHIGGRYSEVYLTKEPQRPINQYVDHREICKEMKQHYDTKIEPMLAQGVPVLCDRWTYSTRAYQAAQGIPLQIIIDLQADIPEPDLVIWLDCSVETALERIVYKDYLEENVEFQRKVRKNYQKMQAKNWYWISADLPKSVIRDMIYIQIEKLFESRDP